MAVEFSSGLSTGDDITVNSITVEAEDGVKYNDPYWKALHVPASAMALGVLEVGPTWAQISGSPGVAALEFSSDKVYSVTFSLQIPRGWQLGSDVEVQLCWGPSTANTGDVVWNLEYVVASPGEAFGSTTTSRFVGNAKGPTNGYYADILETIDLSAYTADSDVMILVPCRLERDPGDASDTYADSAYLYGVTLLYRIDAPGDATDTSK